MTVDDELLARVRRSDRRAVEAVLAECYPAVHRLIYALTGDPEVARRIVNSILRRSLRVMPTWRKGIMPENWFYHHTVITAREQTPPRPPPAERDLLVTAGPGGEPAYVAFVRAIRGLPRQQIEAFLLNHCERLNTRLLGVAMDCSTQAASNHLAAATETLARIAGEQFPALTAALERAYASLSPPETIVRGAVARQAGTVLWRRRFRRLVRRIILLSILALLAYAAWRWRDLLLQWFPSIRSRAQTQKA